MVFSFFFLFFSTAVNFQGVLQLDSTLKLVFFFCTYFVGFVRCCQESFLYAELRIFALYLGRVIYIFFSRSYSRHHRFLLFWLRIYVCRAGLKLSVCLVKCESNPQTKHMLALSFERANISFPTLKAMLSKEPKCTRGIYIRGKTYRIIFQGFVFRSNIGRAFLLFRSGSFFFVVVVVFFFFFSFGYFETTCAQYYTHTYSIQQLTLYLFFGEFFFSFALWSS